MLSLLFKRFKSEALPSNTDLNKKLMEAFASIIDKRAPKAAYSKPSSPIEPIHRYNVDSSPSSLAVSKATNAHSALIPASLQPVINHKNAPDIFRRNKMSPINLHKNVYLMSKMLSPSGSMLSQEVTKLTRKTQRHMSKAIRRARQMGILPYMYRSKVYAVKEQ